MENTVDESSSTTPPSSWTETSVDGSAVDALALGDAAFVNERYDDALTNYTVATLRTTNHEDGIILTRFRIHAHRAAAHAALQNHEDCINDTEIALALLPIPPGDQGTSMLRSGEVELCWRRQGLAYLALKDTAKAKIALEKAKQLADLNSTSSSPMVYSSLTTFDYPTWIQRCNDPKKPSSSGDGPCSDQTKPMANSIVEAREAAMPSTTTTTSSQKQQQARNVPRPVEKPRYQYYQNEKTVTIAILEPNVQASDVTVECDNASIRIHLVKQGKEFSVLGGALQASITDHRVQIRDEKVLIKLIKAKAEEWHELLDPKKASTLPPRVAPTINVTTISDTAVPRPYASRKDWSTIERDIKQQEETETPQGDEAMNKLFQQIYANADEDTRRAMIKSYQTSGGTVLSTNWGEVAAKDYEKERTAPKGVEWKNWEGEKLPMDDDKDD